MGRQLRQRLTSLTDSGVYSGSSTDTLTITAATAGMNGYQYEAVFTNGCRHTSIHHGGHVDRRPPNPPRTQTVAAGNASLFTAANGNPRRPRYGPVGREHGQRVY